MNNLPNIWLFWTGGKEYWEWWTGIQKILEVFWWLEIKDSVKLIVSNNWNWWVRKVAYENWIPFYSMTKLHKREENWEYLESHKSEIKNRYLDIMEKYQLEYIFLSWWLVQVLWYEPNKTVNIHPGPIKVPYWWRWMYGEKVHEKIWQDHLDWKINKTCVTMHYVTDKFDDGPIVAQVPVWLDWCNSALDVQKRVNEIEKIFQWKITLMIMTWEISWSWIEWEPVKFPEWYDWWKEIDLTGE